MDQTPNSNGDCRRFQDLLEKQVIEQYELADFEEAFVAEHRAACAECEAVVGIVQSLADDGEDALDTERESIRAIVDLGMAQRHKRRVTGMAAAAAGLLIIGTVAAITALLDIQTPATRSEFALVRGSLQALGGPLQAGEKWKRLEQVVTAVGGDALIESDKRLFVALSNGASLAVVSSTPKALRLRLSKGRMAVHLVPGSALDLAVDVPDGTVSVHGTIFTVDVGETFSKVGVTRGIVSVVSTRWPDGAPVELRAGSSISFSSRAIGPRPSGENAGLLALLGQPQTSESRGKPLANSSVGMPPVVSVPSERGEGNGEQLQVELETADEMLENHGLESTDGTATRSKTRSPRSTRERPSPEMLIHLARVCRSERDWECAAANYRKVVQWYPDRPDATTALVPLGQILLERRNRPEQALDYFRRYQTKRPDGSLSPEAVWGECNALKKLGRRAEERTCLTRFLKDHPDSLLAVSVKKRLE